MKRVAVTGGSGFVGANLVRRLVAGGHDVHLLMRPGFDPWRIVDLLPNVRVHVVDLLDADAASRTAREIRAEWVFHLAAFGNYSWQTDARRIAATNFTQTVNLVLACADAGFETFVNTGSSAEYGWKDHAPREDEALEPNSAYAVAKAAATWFCVHTSKKSGARIPTLRLYSAYGPWEEPARLVPALILDGLEGKLPPLVNPAVARDYVHVDDVVDAYLLVASSPLADPGAVYNVGAGIQTPMREVVEIARRALGIAETPRWGSMPDRGWDTDTWVSEPSKIRRELGWAVSRSFEDGFRATCDWLRSDHARRAVYAERRARRR